MQDLSWQTVDILDLLCPVPTDSLPCLRGHADGICMTYLDDHLQRHYATIHHYMVAIHVAHIALGLPSPLENCPHLHQLLWDLLPLTTPAPARLWPTWHYYMEFLCWARPLHWLHNAKDSVLWAALTISHYGLFSSSKLAQPKLVEARVAQFIRVWDVTPHFIQGHLHFVCIKLSGSKTDPFQLGCPVIIGCTGTAVCGACKAWCIIQFHRCTWTPLNAPLPSSGWQSPGPFDTSESHQGHSGQVRTQPLQVLWTQLVHWGSHICSASRALPVADKTIRPMEQPGLPTVYPPGPTYVCGLCCPHGS